MLGLKLNYASKRGHWNVLYGWISSHAKYIFIAYVKVKHVIKSQLYTRYDSCAELIIL